MKRLSLVLATVGVAAALAVGLCACAQSGTYTPTEKDPVISAPVVKTDGKLTVGVDTTQVPLAGTSSGKIVGLDVDIAAQIADELGLKLVVVDVSEDPEAALVNGEVDIIMGVSALTSEVSFWRSNIYLNDAVAVFSVTDEPITEVNSDQKVGAQLNSTSAWLVMNKLDDSVLANVSDITALFDGLVEQDGYIYAAADALIGVYDAHVMGVTTYPVALLQDLTGYTIGVVDTNVELQEAIADALETIMTNGVMDIVQTKWLGAPLNLTGLVEPTFVEGESSGEEEEEEE